MSKKSRRPNQRPFWWVGALRFSRNCIKLKKLKKKQGSFDNFCSILMVFQFLEFWLNLSAPTDQRGLQFGCLEFLTPLASFGVEWNKFWSVISAELFWQKKMSYRSYCVFQSLHCEVIVKLGSTESFILGELRYITASGGWKKD